MNKFDEISKLKEQITRVISKVQTLDQLESIRVAYLGKKGTITSLLKKISLQSPEDRKDFGEQVNILKRKTSEEIDRFKSNLFNEELTEKISKNKIDVTLPIPESGIDIGKIHPITQVTEEIIEIFSDMDFDIAEGPDIENDHNNFNALNIPESHPARQMVDTFYLPQVDGETRLLRTHTSPVQIRTMLSKKPPIRIIAPGRTYRSDSDQTHTPMFHQVEGLVIDSDSNMGQLKWVLEEFCKAFFEVPSIKMRLRPSYFPFTEPSLEVDIACHKSNNQLIVGEGEDWLEVLGSGMVHPQVLRNVNLDPSVYKGFAFGMGIDRLAMLKYGMTDLRAFFDSDLRWLRHYGFKVFDIPSLSKGLSE
jgi:phenylalanyl-tRNA synthetase alpha chain